MLIEIQLIQGLWKINMKTILKEISNKFNNKNIFFKNAKDVFYLTRFKSSNLIVLLINENWYAVTDQRYFQQAKKEIVGMEVLDMGQKEWFKNLLEKNKFENIFFNKNDFTISEYEIYCKNFEKYNVKINLFEYGNLTIFNNENDINLLKKSSILNDKIFQNSLSKLKLGMTEKDFQKVILKEIIDSEADGFSFEPIVASGVNSSNPHWSASDKKINKNELITIDLGVYLNGFASDMTRTFVFEGEISEEEIKIWNLVKKALEETTNLLKPGIKCSELHTKAIKIFEKEGYSKYFVHALGHGLGVDIHDYPNISIYSKSILKEGMVITIEPGIYIPNKYGVRLENAILITKDGYEILNKTNMTLFI
ncbi:MAG: Xaa-Pro dipeptidase [Candidatus Tyloplasma litorale]|nr:MAG: Xaa-Pro dipeptidase [Mycoplasmatales bacterium]